jgi:DNA-binding NtrC family response regulator
METRGRVLIVEDQRHVARALELLLEVEGVEATWVGDAASAIAAVEASTFDLVIQDMNFSPGATSGAEGVDLFRRLRELRPTMPVLLITAWGSVDTAVELVKGGAADYLEKPWNENRLLTSVRTQLRLSRLEAARRHDEEARRLARDEVAERWDLRGLVYASREMHEVVSLAVRVARADVPVLITGPNGTGKERLAEIIQANSTRRDRPFVKVNAGALPDTLVEAELFGAEKGAFTGADSPRTGRFEAADGGTLLLDEIANLPLSGQAKLLRVLQTGEFERLGSSKTHQVDVRVLAATNADLPGRIASGTFREDLYFRLNVIEIDVPPLVDRPDDVLPLAEHALARYSAELGRPDVALGDGARRTLVAHDWPGNVRELHNRIQRACLVATVDTISPEDLDLAAGASPGRRSGDEDEPGLRDPEAAEVERVLRQADGVVSDAAERLGISRQALYRRMRRFGIVVERTPRSVDES